MHLEQLGKLEQLEQLERVKRALRKQVLQMLRAQQMPRNVTRRRAEDLSHTRPKPSAAGVFIRVAITHQPWPGMDA
ncbi:hypothetical protein [Streptomyces sp. NPDC059788]|uniref:hypothetical protein n=1 Tax=Streptomyces sp. NPDC059788 TaxID=3346948 RepID=UPI00364D43AE